MPVAYLADRGIVRVGGEDAKTFLDGLLTCDVDRVGSGAPRFGALLTPQGKVLVDFIVVAAGEGGFLLDCLQAGAADLAKRLGFYRLRAKVTVEDVSAAHGVTVGWGDAQKPAGDPFAADDPRLAALGWRTIVTQEPEASPMRDHAAAYHAHRIALGVPEGGKDFSFADAFPHEALMDQLHGVDFDKGCYVGQEVVSRMQHRGTARTRIVPLVYGDAQVPETGAEVRAGERVIGRTGTGASGRGLAMLRVDRAAEALAAGLTIRVGGVPARIELPPWATFSLSTQAATPAA